VVAQEEPATSDASPAFNAIAFNWLEESCQPTLMLFNQISRPLAEEGM